MTDALQNGGAKKRATTKKSTTGKKKTASPWNKFFAAFCKKNAGKIPHPKMMKAASVAYKKK
jgi:hypothetical protein